MAHLPAEIDVEMGRETFVDPRGGKISLGEWVEIWEVTHQAVPATWAAYRSLPNFSQVDPAQWT